MNDRCNTTAVIRKHTAEPEKVHVGFCDSMTSLLQGKHNKDSPLIEGCSLTPPSEIDATVLLEAKVAPQTFCAIIETECYNEVFDNGHE